MPHSNVLFFIPDISGFTKFVAATEIAHSQHIIKSLLEVLVDSNSLGLQVSEVEGDAILFYRPGPPPSLSAFIEQARKMFVNFHTLLRQMEMSRLCQCGACSDASHLTLKIVSHFGPAGTMQVKDHVKFLGKDIIVAHRLLKNTIAEREYFLMTDDLLNSLSDSKGDLVEFAAGADVYEEIGSVGYKYMLLGKYKDEVKVEPLPPFALEKPVKVLALAEQYDTPMSDLFQMMTDLPLRKEWMEGVKEVQIRDNNPNHLGTIHRCVREGDDPELVTSDVKVTETTMEFWETDVAKKVACRFLLEQQSDRSTKVVVELFVQDNPLLKVMFKFLMKKKVRNNIAKSMVNLRALLSAAA
jgi:hypothetical protein